MLAHAGESSPISATTRIGHLRFDHKIALVTILPWTLVLLSGALGVRSVLIDVPLIYLAAPHVLATPALFLQPGLRPHLREHRTFYVVAPIATIGGCLAVFVLAPAGVATAAILGLGLWQIQHFTKQNVGMFSFWTKARDVASPTGPERRIILWTMAIGMAGLVRIANLGTVVTTAAEIVGLSALVGLAVAAVVVGRRGGTARTVALLVSVAFYAPVLVVDVGLVFALLAYQAAHGAQYYLMVGTATRPPLVRGAIAVSLLLLVGPVFAFMGLGIDPYGPQAWLFGLYKGTVSWHFLADSRLWRLRDSQVRGFMKERFSFL